MHQLRLVLVALLLATTGLYAQEGFYYQAVIKNTDGSPLKESEIRIRIRIIEGETTLQFEEEKTITTSREGFVSFIIGESKPDEFATINWQGELYLQDEIDTGEGYGAPTKMPLLKTPRSYISDRAISVLDNSITSASILNQTILTEDLADSSITTGKLADSLITSNKIAKNAVVKEAIATGSISTEAVIDSTLTNIDISPDAAIDVSKINIPDGSITLEKINLEDGIINYSKLNVADGEIPFSKILIENEEIPFEKLNISQENINGLGIVSNYTGGSNLSITETTIDLDDEITLAKVTADLTGDIYNTDSERVLEVGTTDIAAIYTGNVTGNLIGGGGKTVLTNGNNTTLPRYLGDVYYREDDGTETQVVDTKNKIFFGTLKGNLEGSWNGNIIGENNTVVLNPVAEGGALFIGNVEGNLTGDVTGDVASTDITTTNLEATDITASGTITGNVEGNLIGDVTATEIVASGTITGNLTGDVIGNILAEDGTSVLSNGTDGTDATFSGNVTGNADTATKIASIDNDNIVQLESTQTLTNKTLTAPTITGATIDGTLSGDVTGDILADNGTSVLSNGTDGTDATFSGNVTGNADTATKIASIDNDNIVQLESTQTLTNKTLTAPTITGATIDGTLSGDVTGDILADNGTSVLSNGTDGTDATFSGNVTGNADTATKIASIDNDNIVQLESTQTLTNKTLTAPTITGATIDGTLSGDVTGDILADNGTSVLSNGTDGTDATFSGNVTGNADTATKIASIDNDNIVQLESTQTLTNKTLTAPTITGATIDGTLSGDVTGDILADNGTSVLSNGTDGTDATFSGNVTGNADTATKIASIDNDNIVQLESTQTLTNKTLTAPTITGATIDGTLSGDVTGDILADNGTSVLSNGTDGTDATFSGNVTGNLTGNADTATTLSETLPINLGGTGATTAAAARISLGIYSGVYKINTNGAATDIKVLDLLGINTLDKNATIIFHSNRDGLRVWYTTLLDDQNSDSLSDTFDSIRVTFNSSSSDGDLLSYIIIP